MFVFYRIRILCSISCDIKQMFLVGGRGNGRIGVGANILKKIITKLDIHVYSNFVHHSSFNIIQCTKDNCLKTDTHS